MYCPDDKVLAPLPCHPVITFYTTSTLEEVCMVVSRGPGERDHDVGRSPHHTWNQSSEEGLKEIVPTALGLRYTQTGLPTSARPLSAVCATISPSAHASTYPSINPSIYPPTHPPILPPTHSPSIHPCCHHTHSSTSSLSSLYLVFQLSPTHRPYTHPRLFADPSFHGLST